MTLAQTVGAMVAAGCSPAQIAAVVQHADEARRAKARDGNRQRQADFRAKRNASNGVTQRDTPLSVVTARDQRDTTAEPRAPAFFMGEESNIPLSHPSDVRVPTGTPTEKRAKRIPEDWKPTEHHFEVGAEHGLTRAQVKVLASEFLNFWLGDGRRKLDWGRTFTNRIVDQAPRVRTNARAGPNGHHAKPPSALQTLIDIENGTQRPPPDDSPARPFGSGAGPLIEGRAITIGERDDPGWLPAA